MTSPALVLHLHSGDYDRLHQGCALAAAATALGQTVLIAFYMHALRRLADGALARPETLEAAGGEAQRLAEGMEKAGAPTAAELLRSARDSGNTQIIACSASMQFWGLKPDALADQVDEIAGVTTILRRGAGSESSLYL